MKIYLTEIRAIDPISGEIKLWGGPNIKALSYEEAVKKCQKELGYCKVVGELIAEIPYSTAEFPQHHINNLN